MYRTLFFVPHQFAGIPLFGVGWLLGAIVLYGIALVLFASRDPKRKSELSGGLGMCVVAAAVVVFIFPRLEILDQKGEPIGMAIRGYGMMLLLGVLSAVGVAIVRAKRRGISADTVLAAAPWLFVLGIFGARAFYVIEYRDRFVSDNLISMIGSILDFTRGGIVVYGSLIGGFIGLIIFCRRNHVPFFRMADIIIPCVFIGLFFGRIGCLMNGCCYGGRCDPPAFGLDFPPGSPVYEDQAKSGELIGLEVHWPVGTDEAVPGVGMISSVRADSLAEAAGIKSGQAIRIHLERPPPEEARLELPMDDTSQLSVVAEVDGKTHRWKASQLPDRALRVAPTQIYSSLMGLSIAAVLMLLSTWVRREGVLMGLGFAIYAVVRFGLEAIRSDEPGQFGTGLTISQWVSIVVLLGSITLITWLLRQPRPTEATA